MYAMLCTRPDICFAIGLVSRYQNNPGQAHWQAVKKIMHYLCGTTDLVLCYQGEDFKLRGYSDADWGVTQMSLGQPQDMCSPWVGEPYDGE